jgi:hypothetical protein
VKKKRVPTKCSAPESNVGIGRNDDVSLFDSLALEYDAWFDREGSFIFFIEVQAFRELLPTLPRPWLEKGELRRMAESISCPLTKK